MTIKPGQNPNQVIDKHIRAGCPDVTVKTKKNPCRLACARLRRLPCQERPAARTIPEQACPCSFAGCREKEFIPVSCKLCKQPFCLKHRFETDHPCPKNGAKAPGVGLFKAPPAKAAAGAAAVARAGAGRAAPAKATHEQQRQQQLKQQDELRAARAQQYQAHRAAGQAGVQPAAQGSQGGALQSSPGAMFLQERRFAGPGPGPGPGPGAPGRGPMGPDSQARRGKDKHSNSAQSPAGAQGSARASEAPHAPFHARRRLSPRAAR